MEMVLASLVAILKDVRPQEAQDQFIAFLTYKLDKT